MKRKKGKEVIRAKAEHEKELKIQRQVITSKSSFQQFKKVGEIDLNKTKKEEKLDVNSNQNINQDKTDLSNVNEKPKTKIDTKYEKLSGIKETGQTINLDNFKKSEPKVDTHQKTKRKRRRIAKDVVNKESVTEKNKNFKLNKGKIPPSAPSDDEVQAK